MGLRPLRRAARTEASPSVIAELSQADRRAHPRQHFYGYQMSKRLAEITAARMEPRCLLSCAPERYGVVTLDAAGKRWRSSNRRSKPPGRHRCISDARPAVQGR
jgi:hypothetical protein